MKFFFDLFDLTSFFPWTFLNFLARRRPLWFFKNPIKITYVLTPNDEVEFRLNGLGCLWDKSSLGMDSSRLENSSGSPPWELVRECTELSRKSRTKSREAITPWGTLGPPKMGEGVPDLLEKSLAASSEKKNTKN